MATSQTVIVNSSVREDSRYGKRVLRPQSLFNVKVTTAALPNGSMLRPTTPMTQRALMT
jgi:hypothetical protein